MNNQHIKILQTEILSDHWYTLKKVTFEQFSTKKGWMKVEREAYDRGNGAAILLYNPIQNEDGMMIEVCAGLLDDHNPEECIRKETEEETGYRIKEVHKVMEAYMSPGSVTEILYFFVGLYEPDMKVNDGGGLEEDHEEIEVLEVTFPEVIEMVTNKSIKDAKTIMLIQYAQIHDLLKAK